MFSTAQVCVVITYIVLEAGPKIQKYFTYMLHGCCGACIFSYRVIPASGSLSTVLGKMEENVSMDICMTYLYRNINSSITRIFRIYVEKRGISSKAHSGLAAYAPSNSLHFLVDFPGVSFGPIPQ